MKQMHDLRERLDSLGQGGSNAQTIAQDEQIGAGTVAEIATYLPVIRDAFSEAFDCESASCAITLSSDDSGFPVYVGVDASCSDPERVSAARASGGRLRFYRKLSDILPGPLLDLVGFRFKFPHVGSS